MWAAVTLSFPPGDCQGALVSEFIEIIGGVPLKGSVHVSGAKNGALPLIIASLLTSERVTFRNIPKLEDIGILAQLLEHFGGEVDRAPGEISVQVKVLRATEASYSLVKALRASFWVLAPLLARGRAARVALPGGDIIGARPVDIHLDALAKMGADIQVKHGVVLASAPGGLKPAELEFRFPSVGATHQILMAAALTPGTTVLRGAAREPEVTALADFINSIGGDVEGAGSSTVVVRGRTELGGGEVSILGDRIEAATYCLAALATGGDISVLGFEPIHFGSFSQILVEMGAAVERVPQGLRVSAPNGIQPISVTTAPFPLFATDIQAPLVAALCLAHGESRVEETMFEGRFAHVAELCRMGARIQVTDRTAIITGVPQLSGAPVESFDIRAAAALVVAGLAARGVTSVFEPQHLRRGYDSLEQKLSGLGAKVRVRVSDPEDFIFTGC
ncbi:MAG: UDP-N-acetylglucosamine 1-carboxyvinyltransferase [Proteobacteria bacterium]|nr:UDP-N-acetylglucosamine 1-carboxyvinyltransferase [Pseudomonadota bacterium]